MSQDTLFPPEHAEAVDGLAWLGHLEDEVAFCGHTFLLRTLKGDEELEAAAVAKEYQDTFGQVKATTWAHLAAAIMEVDGRDDFCPPIGPSRKQHLRAKFNYITSNWYWPVAQFLFDRYVALVQRQADAIEAVEDLSARSLHSSWGTVDSLRGQEDSKETSTPSNSDASAISPEQMRTLADENE